MVVKNRTDDQNQTLRSGVLVRVSARVGKEDDVEELLDAVLRISTREQHTETTFVMRFADGTYGLLDLFSDERCRREHLSGAARQAIAYRARDLFDNAPTDCLVDVVGHALPTVAGRARLAGGTWLNFSTDDRSSDDRSTGDRSTGDRSTGDDLSISTADGSAWLALRFEGGGLAVIALAQTHDDPQPIRLPEVRHANQELALVSTERFRLIGPDVPEPVNTPLVHLPQVDVTATTPATDRLSLA